MAARCSTSRGSCRLTPYYLLLTAPGGSMKKCLHVIALVMAVAIATTAEAQERVKLHISTAAKTLGYGPLWIASRMGFFERQGLDVDVVAIRASDVGVQALAGGSIEIAGSA